MRNQMENPGIKSASVENAEVKMREVIFRQIIETHITEALFKKFKESGFSDDQIQELRKNFLKLSDQKREWIESLPHELRQRQIPFLYKKFAKGEITTDKILESLMVSGEKLNRNLGFHCSDKNILPEKSRDGLGQIIETWNIVGTEKDHRNNDLPMAYYSEDYYHLYLTKNPKYLYVVSSNRASGTGHHRDNTTGWGRANYLSVVDRFDLFKVRQEVDDYMKTYRETLKNAKN